MLVRFSCGQIYGIIAQHRAIRPLRGDWYGDLNVNGKTYQADVDPRTPLLWVLRDTIGPDRHQVRLRHRPVRRLHRTCAGVATRLLLVPVSAVAGKPITTVEGLAPDGTLHKVQQAWLDHDVPQCGYCQSGIDHGGGGPAQGQSEADRRGYRWRDHQYLPLRHLSAGARARSTPLPTPERGCSH